MNRDGKEMPVSHLQVSLEIGTTDELELNGAMQTLPNGDSTFIADHVGGATNRLMNESSVTKHTGKTGAHAVRYIQKPMSPKRNWQRKTRCISKVKLERMVGEYHG